MNGLYRRQKLDVHNWRNTVEWTVFIRQKLDVHNWRNTVEWTVYKAEIRRAQLEKHI